MIGFARDPSSDIRDSVVYALPQFGLADESLEVIRTMSRDSAVDVRDWATFVLATSDDDGEATRDALLARADDEDDDTRAEGIYGLARRQDPRARALIDREYLRPTIRRLIEDARELLDQPVDD